MILIQLKDQLGNQMFAYAAVKAIALDKQVKFGIMQADDESLYINSNDAIYGKDITSIFSIPCSEVVSNASEYAVYRELPLRKRRGEFEDDIRKINDNTVCDGHFISCKYFIHRISEVREWFRLPDDIINNADTQVNSLKNKYMKRNICSVHFRVGKDYYKLGYLMNLSYWVNAANTMLQKDPETLFVVVYDRKTKKIEKFIKRYNAVEIHGSLVEDMALIGACDTHIVCNSTFSIMSSLIDYKEGYTVCPTVYYSGIHKMPDTIFPEEWTHVKCERDIKSFISGFLYTCYVKTTSLLRTKRRD